MRRLSLILALLALCGAFGAASAQASPWTLTTLNLGDGETIFGMHCEPNGFCVGVGQEGVVIQSSAPTAGASAWTIGHVSPGRRPERQPARDLLPVHQPLRRGRLQRRRLDDHQPGRSAPATWTPTKIPKVKSLFGVNCLSESQCVLVGSGGVVVTSSNPTGGPTAWTRTALACRPAAARGHLRRDALRGQLLQRRNLDHQRAAERRLGLDLGRPARGRTADARA